MNRVDKIRLGDVVEFQRGYDLPKTQFITGSYPVISSGGVLGWHNIYKADSPGMVIGRSGTVGKPTFIDSKYFPHNTTLFVKNFKGNYPRYVYYLVESLKLDEWKSGSGVPTLNRNHLHPLEIDPIPEPNEQKIVADVIWRIDKKIKINNRINAELEAMAKTIYDYWFVQFDFPDENGKPYKSSGGKMVWSEELKREIPEGWEVKKLEQVESNIVTGKTPSTKDDTNFDGNTPFICIGDVRGNTFIVDTEISLSQKGAELQKNKFIPKGSLCVTCIATPGLVGIATQDSQTNQQLNSIVISKEYNRYYLYEYLRDYFRFASAKSGNTFANMNKGDFSSILTINPSTSILQKFNQQIKSYFELNHSLSKSNIELAKLRDWLLPMLMNGQVRVKEQND